MTDKIKSQKTISFGIKDFNIPEGKIPIVCICLDSNVPPDEITGSVLINETGVALIKESGGYEIIAHMLLDAGEQLLDKKEAVR